MVYAKLVNVLLNWINDYQCMVRVSFGLLD